jgi:hypothetical protein
MNDLVLPVFAMDCRDWLVTTPGESGLPDEIAGAPLLAVLSTVVVTDGEFRTAGGVLTVGLLDAGRPASPRCGRVAERIEDTGEDAHFRRYLLPAPARRAPRRCADRGWAGRCARRGPRRRSATVARAG